MLKNHQRIKKKIEKGKYVVYVATRSVFVRSYLNGWQLGYFSNACRPLIHLMYYEYDNVNARSSKKEKLIILDNLNFFTNFRPKFIVWPLKLFQIYDHTISRWSFGHRPSTWFSVRSLFLHHRTPLMCVTQVYAYNMHCSASMT